MAMDYSFRSDALILGWSIIYIERGVTAYNCQIKLHLFLCASLSHICIKQCRPWWNASFRLGLHYLADGTHLCPISINGSSIIVQKKLLDSYPPKWALLSIFIMCVWGSEDSHMRRFNPSRLAFAIKIINSWARSHDHSDFIITNHKMHFSK